MTNTKPKSFNEDPSPFLLCLPIHSTKSHRIHQEITADTRVTRFKPFAERGTAAQRRGIFDIAVVDVKCCSTTGLSTAGTHKAGHLGIWKTCAGSARGTFGAGEPLKAISVSRKTPQPSHHLPPLCCSSSFVLLFPYFHNVLHLSPRSHFVHRRQVLALCCHIIIRFFVFLLKKDARVVNQLLQCPNVLN